MNPRHSMADEMRRIRLLQIEDNEDDALLVLNELRRGGFDTIVECIDTAGAMEAALKRHKWDIIISDYSLPRFSGLDALAVLKRHNIDVPFILVSGTIGEVTAVAGMKAGAQDYIMKNNLSRLVPAVERELQEAEVRRQRKQSEEKLRQSEDQFRLIMENVADLIAVLDLKGKRLYNSPSYKNVLGDPEELLGTDSFMEIHPEDRGKVKQIFQETLRTGVGQRTEYRFLLNDKSIRHIESQGSVIRDRNGNVTNVVVVSRDVTERKNLEAQFLRVQRMESIGTLAGGIAHDLNNVLAPIMLSIQILKKRYSIEADQKLLKALESSAKRGIGMVKQVLTFARGVEGERVPLQIKHLVSEMEKIMRETFPRSIHALTKIAKEPWTISGDATQLHQVLMNLCVNARDAMPNGGTLTIEIENTGIDEQYVRMHPEARPGPYTLLTVHDTGTGMPPEILDKIFEPFFTTKEIGKGTGLGLSTVIGIVKNHRGFINVYSEVGHGTKFHIYLPAQEERGDSTHTAHYRSNRTSLGE